MKKEYTLKATETTSGIFYIRAASKEEAVEKFLDETDDGGYRDMMETVESFTVDIVDEEIIDGTEIKAFYLRETDTTIIWEYTYENGATVREQIIGYYHGTPDEENTERYAYLGVIGKVN